MPKRISYYRPTHLAPADPAYRRLAARVEANRFYSSTRWRSLRKAFLAEHPLCEDCRAAGRVTPAIDVHHVLDRKPNPDKAFDWDNLQALCRECHNAKRRTGGG
jgi:5-methylcytosine-specific restriction enzyme A